MIYGGRKNIGVMIVFIYSIIIVILDAWDPTLHWDEEEGNDDLSGDNILDK